MRSFEELGQPGAEEAVLAHAATLGKEALAEYLRPLLEHERRPFTALTLGLRVLREVEPAAVEPELAAAFLVRALRLMSWLPGARLPGAAGYETLAWEVLARLAGPLRGHGVKLVEACHEEVRAWLRGDGLTPAEVQRRKLAERLAKTLGLQVPVKALLQFEQGARLLVERRGRGGLGGGGAGSLPGLPGRPGGPGGAHGLGRVRAGGGGAGAPGLPLRVASEARGRGAGRAVHPWHPGAEEGGASPGGAAVRGFRLPRRARGAPGLTTRHPGRPAGGRQPGALAHAP